MPCSVEFHAPRLPRQEPEPAVDAADCFTPAGADQQATPAQPVVMLPVTAGDAPTLVIHRRGSYSGLRGELGGPVSASPWVTAVFVLPSQGHSWSQVTHRTGLDMPTPTWMCWARISSMNMLSACTVAVTCSSSVTDVDLVVTGVAPLAAVFTREGHLRDGHLQVDG